jgi:hypothetical protein
MTKIAIVPNAAGTGTFTIEAPNSNSNRTLVLPDSAGTVATAESTLAQFNATGSAPVYACRAWVNFDGTTTTPTIRASGNVSSVTRTGTGNYIVNFATAMPDANYSTNISCGHVVGTSDLVWSLNNTSAAAPTTSAFRISTSIQTGAAANPSYVFAAVFR